MSSRNSPDYSRPGGKEKLKGFRHGCYVTGISLREWGREARAGREGGKEERGGEGGREEGVSSFSIRCR